MWKRPLANINANENNKHSKRYEKRNYQNCEAEKIANKIADYLNVLQRP